MISVVLAMIIAIAWILVRVPRRWAREYDFEDAKDRFKAEGEYRTAIAKAISMPSVAIGAIGALITIFQGIQSYRHTQQGVFLKRYQAVLSDLSNDDEERRLRAANSIELLVQDEPERARAFLYPLLSAIRRKGGTGMTYPNIMAQDLVSVLATIPRGSTFETPVNLSHLNLSGLNAIGVSLSHSILVDMDLSDSNFAHAHLDGADLYRSKLYTR